MASVEWLFSIWEEGIWGVAAEEEEAEEGEAVAGGGEGGEV